MQESREESANVSSGFPLSTGMAYLFHAHSHVRHADIARRRAAAPIGTMEEAAPDHSMGGNGASAGPEITSPSVLNRDPCHGQSHDVSAGFQ